jgi:hypothetical protein
MTEESSEKLIPEITALELIEELKIGAETYAAITQDFISNFTFYDQTLYDWALSLNIEIPKTKNLDIVSFRALLVLLAKNLQIASNYYSVACSMVDAIHGGNSMKKSDIVNLLVTNYAVKGAKRPAASVIERMADSYLTNTVSAGMAAKIVKNFWKQRVDTLQDLRKIFEQIGLSLSVEMKFTST